MGQLKHDADDAAGYEPRNCVKQSDLPKRMSNERHQERNGDESQFPPNEAYQLPTLGSAKWTTANAALDEPKTLKNGLAAMERSLRAALPGLRRLILTIGGTEPYVVGLKAEGGTDIKKTGK